MSKYKEAARYYDEMIACWKALKSNHDRAYNHSKAISSALAIADLGLPNPWANIKDEPEEPEVKVEEPKVEEVRAEVVKPAFEPAKSADRSYKHFDFKRK